MKKSKTLILLLLFVVASTKAYAVQDSIIPLTAKTAWNLVYKQVELDYGVPPILFKASPEKNIDKKDTLLCATYKNQYGSDSIIWNGKTYTWIFECRIPALSTDSMFIISIYDKFSTLPFITKETIYKPITEYGDTVGIAEDTWFDSDSLFIKLASFHNDFFPVVFLQRDIYSHHPPPIKTTWNIQILYSGTDIWANWWVINAQTGGIIAVYATSVSEPTTSDGITISPNPVSTSLTISGIEGVTSVRIMNSLGMEAKKITVNSEKLIVDVSDLASGVYFVQFRTLAGVVSKPIVVSR